MRLSGYGVLAGPTGKPNKLGMFEAAVKGMSSYAESCIEAMFVYLVSV